MDLPDRLKHTYRLFVAASVLLMCRCAQPGVPSGGEKDEQPPVVVHSEPLNESVNFSGKVIKIEFDEFVQLNDIYNQLIVSPPLSEKPTISLKKKNLMIELNEELRETTTYTFNFGEGIKDNNEGNILRNFLLAFSTGPTLDSLSMSGKVFDAKTAKPRENVKVMIYDELQDSLPKTSKPTYFSQTDKTGKFEIKYLPKGKYKVFALEEENRDFLFTEMDENIGFLVNPVELSEVYPNKDSLSISLFNEEKDLGYLSKVDPDSLGQYKITFDKKQKDVLVTQISGESLDTLQQFLTESLDTLYFFTQELSDVFVSRTDSRFSNSLEEIDTLMLKEYDSSEVSSLNKSVRLKPMFKRALDMSKPLVFRSYHPITLSEPQVQIESLDSVQVNVLDVSLESDFSFQVNADLEAEKSYKGLILPGGINSYGLTNTDTTRFSFKTFPLDYFGDLELVIGFSIDNPLILIKNLKGDIVTSSSEHDSYTFDFKTLEPGSYKIYLVDDTDSNGEWTTGNYDLKRLPESVYEFPQEIEVRSNWSQRFEWNP